MFANKYKVHRADSRKVKNFIRSFGNVAKTDILDAKSLAKYGYERSDSLSIYTSRCERDIELYQLVQRREDLIAMSIAEKNRLKSAGCNRVQKIVKSMLRTITRHIDNVTK